MNAAEADLRFPVLAIPEDRGEWADVWGPPTLDILQRCGPRALKDGLQIGIEIIDLEGRRFIVRSVRRVGRDRPLLRWIVGFLLAGPQYRIEHELEPLKPLSLEETQEKVCVRMRAHPECWQDHELTLPELLEGVAATRTIGEIHALLSLDDFRVP
ncbi:MAG TPA: hypothetical protein VL460_09515 [Caulobacteraceae bacterium]|nr:hypothetical protein [Caulobacteraceae bacterium]